MLLSVPIASLASVVKIGALLFMRIFFLPVCLGLFVLSCINLLLKIPTAEWVHFSASNVVGSVALSWVAGITYMLTVTLSVLQLREVLHPDILAKFIRPQVINSKLLIML
jgi:E3 ubiquitin-protein ligase MARCH6